MNIDDNFSAELKALIGMTLKEFEEATEPAEPTDTTDPNDAFINYMTESGFTRKEK